MSKGGVHEVEGGSTCGSKKRKEEYKTERKKTREKSAECMWALRAFFGSSLCAKVHFLVTPHPSLFSPIAISCLLLTNTTDNPLLLDLDGETKVRRTRLCSVSDVDHSKLSSSFVASLVSYLAFVTPLFSGAISKQ